MSHHENIGRIRAVSNAPGSLRERVVLVGDATEYTARGGSITLELLAGKKQFTPSFVHEYLLENT
ncbi:MAG TPA: hypothetical protein VHT72_07410, partial [Puia sp.]|nr:hypothetical protein [Puia sp.]